MSIVEMDRLKKLWSKVWGSKKSRTAFLAGLAILALAGGGFGYTRVSKPKRSVDKPAHNEARRGKVDHDGNELDEAGEDAEAREEHAEHSDAELSAAKAEERAVLAPVQKGFFARMYDRYDQAWHDFNHRLSEIRRSDEENESLRLENANLRLKVEALAFDCRARDAASRTKSIELKLSDETWAMAGRSLETILYEIPPHLLPPQLYTLAVSYFKNAEYEKAAKIMTRLTGMEDSDAFKSARNMLMTGMLWYRLDNYALADKYFDKALQFGDSVENNPFKAQARLWRALIAQRLDKHEKAQAWLLELLDHHPKSVEAAWVNAREGMRARKTASH